MVGILVEFDKKRVGSYQGVREDENRPFSRLPKPKSKIHIRRCYQIHYTDFRTKIVNFAQNGILDPFWSIFLRRVFYPFACRRQRSPEGLILPFHVPYSGLASRATGGATATAARSKILGKPYSELKDGPFRMHSMDKILKSLSENSQKFGGKFSKAWRKILKSLRKKFIRLLQERQLQSYRLSNDGESTQYRQRMIYPLLYYGCWLETEIVRLGLCEAATGCWHGGGGALCVGCARAEC